VGHAVFNWKQQEPRKQARFHCRKPMTTADPIGIGQPSPAQELSEKS